MNTYRISFNTRSLKAAVHAPTCRVVQGARKGHVDFPVQAATAADAARDVYVREDFADRKLALPTVCACCRGT
jgi:hypothetical protein